MSNRVGPYNEEVLMKFKQFYKNFINSISKKDYTFLKKKCEKKLFLNLKKTLDEDNDKMYINDLKEEKIKINIQKIIMQLNLGASIDREFNKRLVKADEQNNIFQNLKKQVPDILVEFAFYKLNQKENINNLPVNLENNLVRFYIDLKTNYIISRTPLKDENQFEEHSLIYEWDVKQIVSTYKILKQHPLIKKNPILEGAMKDAEDLKIVISDFDNYLNGNKFI